MKITTLILSFLFSVIALPNLAQAYANSDDYHVITKVEVNEVVPTAVEIYSSALTMETSGKRVPELSTFDVADWNLMVTIGEKLIEIIKAGQSVVNIKRDVVSVVPAGVQSWEQLSGWKVPMTKVFEVKATNGWGTDVVKMRLKISAMNNGAYLANVLIVPSELVVQWGFNVDVWSENRPPVNVGTASVPVAGLGFDIRYKIKSLMSEKNGTQDYFVTGNGELVEL